MLFYPESWYICPCGEDSDSLKKGLPSSLAPRNQHLLPDLYFCPTCHIPRCTYCSDVVVVCKYCANCMTDYTDSAGTTRCTKNCFECPECLSPLTVTIHDDPTLTGKQFKFSCSHCTYIYTTKTVLKPAPLSTILKNEHHSYFQDLYEKHALSHRLFQLDSGSKRASSGPKLSQIIITKMREMKIERPSLDDLNEHEELTMRLSEFSAQPVDIDADFVQKQSTCIPRGNHLSAKTSFSCFACGTKLLSPVADARLMKYLEKELAIEVVPLVSAIKSAKNALDPLGVAVASDISCVLNIVNPTLHSMNVTISTIEIIPSDISGTEKDVSLSLPITRITVPARREKSNVLESIPSVCLTDSTQAARAEKLSRTIRAEAIRRSTGPDEPFVEQGMNWVSLPFTATIKESQEHSSPNDLYNSEFEEQNSENCISVSHLRLPFYVTVETRLPSQWSTRGDKGLKYGVWVMCELN